MADVQSTATLTVNVTGQEKVEALKSSLDSLKSSAGTAAVESGKGIEALGKQAEETSQRILKMSEITATAKPPSEEEWAAELARRTPEAIAAFRAERGERIAPIAPEAPAPPTDVVAQWEQWGANIGEKAGAIVGQIGGMAEAAAQAAASLGGVTLALGALWGAAKAVELLKSSFDWAGEAAQKGQRIASIAARTGETWDDASDKWEAGTQLFGKGYERSFAGIQKTLASEKKLPLLETLGITEEETREPLAIARRIAQRRAELQAQVAEADTPEARTAAQSTMTQFFDALHQAFPQRLANQFAVLTATQVDQAMTQAREAREAAQLKVPAMAPAETAEAGVAFEQMKAGVIGVFTAMRDEIGRQATTGWTDIGEKLRQSLLNIAPEMTAIGTTITTKLQEILGGAAEGIQTDAFKAKLEEFRTAIEGIDVSAAVTGVTEAFKMLSAAASGVAGVISGIAGAFRQLQAVAGALGQIAGGDFIGGLKNLNSALREDYGEIADRAKEAGDAQHQAITQQSDRALTNIQTQTEAQEQGSNVLKRAWDWVRGAKPEAPPAEVTPAAAPEVPVKPDVSELKAAIEATEIKVPDMSGVGEQIGSTAASSIQTAGAGVGEQIGSTASAGMQAGGAAAGTAAGSSFSGTATAGLSAAGAAAGSAFQGAVNPGAIGSAIGAAAAAAISAAKVNVNVNVAGAGGGGASTGKDSAT